VGPRLLSGLIVYPAWEGKSVLRKYREFMAQAPEELQVWCVLRKAPPLPFLPPEAHGKDIIALALCYAGDPAEGEPLVAPLHKLGAAVGAHVGVQPYTAWQQAFDPLLGAGARNYWKSHNFSALDDGYFDAILHHAGNLPSPQCEIFLGSVGNAISRPAMTSTAYAQRDAQFTMNIHGRWDDAADDARGICWTRDVFDATAPFANGGVYVNFLTADEGERVRNAYGPNYDRLARVKRQYDPENRFRLNQNISPKG